MSAILNRNYYPSWIDGVEEAYDRWRERERERKRMKQTDPRGGAENLNPLQYKGVTAKAGIRPSRKMESPRCGGGCERPVC